MRVGERPPARVTLAVRGASGGAFAVALSDEAGHDGHGTFALDLDRPFHTARKQSWRQFLASYADGVGPGTDDLAQFGTDLFRALILQTDLRTTWAEIVAAASGRPLHLTVELGSRAEPFARLPLELL